MAKLTKIEAMVRLRVPTENRPPAEAANWFHFARIDENFQLLVGYIDMAELHVYASQDASAQDKKPVEVAVTRRIVLSRSSMEMLRKGVDDILDEGSEE